MKKIRIRQVLLLLAILFVITGYTDIKRGFAEGFEYRHEDKRIPEPVGNNNVNKHFKNAGSALPLIIKM